MGELDFDVGTENIHCDCSNCTYCLMSLWDTYVVTDIIRDAKRHIAKGPSL